MQCAVPRCSPRRRGEWQTSHYRSACLDRGGSGRAAPFDRRRAESWTRSLRPSSAENASNFPLSYGQKALLYLSRLDPDTPTYNAMFAIRLDAEVSIEALRTALQGIIDRHAALRTTYVLNGE